jgi:hypothetical protein
VSLHISAISIEGDAREAIEEVFARCGYSCPAPPETVDTWDALHAALVDAEQKAALYHDSRTTILDPELVMMFDEDPLRDLSKPFGFVCAMVCEGVSATYGFSVFGGGEKVRSLIVTGGNPVDESGDPLPEEDDVSAASLSEDTVLEILARLGFDYVGLEKASGLKVYHLEFAEDRAGKAGERSSQDTPFRDKKP